MSEGFTFTGHKPHRAAPVPVTGRVIRSDDTGVWVAPLGGDPRHPAGPCLGGRYRDHNGDLQRIPARAVVLLIYTDDGPWVAAWEVS